jgi:predicted amidophosphoribosyltransferase
MSEYRFMKIEHGVCPHIDSADECYYLMDYHSKKGYAHSTTNNLILNFKKRIGENGQSYKIQAIGKFAEVLCKLFNEASNLIFVPIPPSKTKDDPMYDNRLTQVLTIVKADIKLPYYEILERQTSILPLHENHGPRLLSTHKFKFNCEDMAVFRDKTIVIFDDVITTGSTYKAAKNILKEHFPNNKIVGLFLARAISTLL